MGNNSQINKIFNTAIGAIKQSDAVKSSALFKIINECKKAPQEIIPRFDHRRMISSIILFLIALFFLLYHTHVKSSESFIAFSTLFGMAFSAFSSSEDGDPNYQNESMYRFLIEYFYHLVSALLISAVTFLVINKYSFTLENVETNKLVFYLTIFAAINYLISHLAWIKKGGPLLNLNLIGK